MQQSFLFFEKFDIKYGLVSGCKVLYPRQNILGTCVIVKLTKKFKDICQAPSLEALRGFDLEMCQMKEGSNKPLEYNYASSKSRRQNSMLETQDQRLYFSFCSPLLPWTFNKSFSSSEEHNIWLLLCNLIKLRACLIG